MKSKLVKFVKIILPVFIGVYLTWYFISNAVSPELRSFRYLTFESESAALNKLSKMPPPEIPQLTFMGDSDKVISKKAIESRMARTPLGELKILTNSMHEVFFETSDIKEEIWEEMDKFLNKIFPN